MFCLGKIFANIATDPVERGEGEDPYSTVESSIPIVPVGVSPMEVDVIAGPVGGGGSDGAGFDAGRREVVGFGGGLLRVPS